jgi:hypothetical protein
MTIFPSSFLRLVYSGFCQGIGVEISFFLLWVSYKAAHGRVSHKIHEDHWFQKLGEYFK